MLGFRQSKFKNIYGQGTKKELCYDNVRVTKNAWDSNLIKVNPLFISLNWDAAGGGALAVIPLSERGKLPDLIPLFKGHSGPVLDTDFNPFNDSVLASGSEDGKICLWSVPLGFTVLEKGTPDVSPVSKLSGHLRKVGNVTFHPTADNILASTSGDHTLKMWDVIKSSNQITLKHADIIQSLSFNREGNSLVTTCRDKKIRIWDPRMQKVAMEAPGHAGAKNSRAVYLGSDRIATAGFGKMSDRQLGLWDVKNLSGPINGFTMLDQSAGVIMPFYDYDTKVLYLAGKGDGNIRYYELENDEFWPLAEYKSLDPQRGVAFMPKRALALHENEVMRAYKTVRDMHIEPISFIVPRRSESFQADIYPDTISGDPSLTADEWFSGQDAPPRLISMESIYHKELGAAPGHRPFDPLAMVEQETKVEPKANSSPQKVLETIVSPEGPVHVKTEPRFPLNVGTKAPAKEQQGAEALERNPDPSPPKNPPSPQPASRFADDDIVQRLVSVVERQSEVIEGQAKRIEWLENQHTEYLKALSRLEMKLDGLAVSTYSKGKEALEDQDGTYVEV